MVLNIESSYDVRARETVKQRPLHTEFDSPPSEEEVERALCAIKGG